MPARHIASTRPVVAGALVELFKAAFTSGSASGDGLQHVLARASEPAPPSSARSAYRAPWAPRHARGTATSGRVHAPHATISSRPPDGRRRTFDCRLRGRIESDVAWIAAGEDHGSDAADSVPWLLGAAADWSWLVRHAAGSGRSGTDLPRRAIRKSGRSR